MSSEPLIFEQYIDAPAAQVYQAFTNATALREWLCDIASAIPKPGGRLYLSWNSGFYTAGEYAGLEPDRMVAFSWRGRDDPGVSQVHVTIAAQNGGSSLRLEHCLPKTGEEWGMTAQEIETGWRASLENLASVLGVGEDLRLLRRPMLGILPSDFNAEIARHLGIPVSEGVRIDGLVDGLGAQKAGLQANDVLIEMDGRAVTGFASLPAILQRRQAGDLVEVVFYRRSEKRSLMMELSRRPLPEIPPTLAELRLRVQADLGKALADVQAFFKDVSDAEAGFKPAEGEWSALETLAHLVQGERFWQQSVVEIVTCAESWVDEWGGNLPAQTLALVQAYPTVAEMLEALKRAYAETTALYANLPADFQQRKGSYWRLAYNALESPGHFYTHLEQMRAAIQAARAV